MNASEETDSIQHGERPRQRLPDELRGLALLGIVVVNMPFLAISADGFTPASMDSALDRATAFIVVAFAQGKFYLLFSFLFGYSLTLMMRGRQTADGARRYRRRLLGLAVLGIMHGALFFVGDILLSYALLGLVLLWFRPRRDRAALRGAAAAYVAALGVLILLAVGAAASGDLGDSGDQGGFVADSASFDVAMAGSFGDAVLARVQALPGVLLVLAVLNWGQVVAMFLVGLVAGRRGVLAHPERYRSWWRWLLVLAVAVGVPGGVASGWLAVTGGGSTTQDALGVALGFASAPALTGGYVALAARLTGGRLLSGMSHAGRMSLTCYLGESVLMSALFCGWGFGWFGQVGAFHGALVAIGVWVVLEVYARVWFTRYRQGPAEWVLRRWVDAGRRRGASVGTPSTPAVTGSAR
ncbi:MAG: DUF418 domain-containing protein [Angustibacter sp.]